MTWRNRTTTLRHPHNALPTNHNGAAPPRPRSPHQSQQHSATQTRLSPAITTARRHPHHTLPAITTAPRHPDQAPPSNHNGTAPPRPSSPQQSQRHSTAQTSNHNGTAPPRPGSPSNHNGTAPPRPGSPQQSQRHGATQTRLSPAITTARRHPDQALPSNHNGTAPQSFAQATPLEANPKGTAHRAQNGRARTLAAAIPKSERTRSRPQTPQTKTRTLRYAFGKRCVLTTSNLKTSNICI